MAEKLEKLHYTRGRAWKRADQDRTNVLWPQICRSYSKQVPQHFNCCNLHKYCTCNISTCYDYCAVQKMYLGYFVKYNHDKPAAKIPSNFKQWRWRLDQVYSTVACLVCNNHGFNPKGHTLLESATRIEGKLRVICKYEKKEGNEWKLHRKHFYRVHCCILIENASHDFIMTHSIILSLLLLFFFLHQLVNFSHYNVTILYSKLMQIA